MHHTLHFMLAVLTPFGRLVMNIIYYVGGTNFSEDWPYDERNTRNLLKLNAKNPSSGWKITSSSRTLIGRKLYVDVSPYD